MAMNPMQRKANNSFLLGILITLLITGAIIGFLIYQVSNLNSELERAISTSGNQPVLLCSSPIRLPFRRLIERTYPQIAVMSYNEISNNIKAKSIGVVRVAAVRN